MIIVDIEQNGDEWEKIRLGAITSSYFKDIVTSTGARSKSRQKYMDKLASEIITGEREKSFYNKAMEEGHIREQENINHYQFRSSCKITKVGFCWKDEKKLYGASPDALVNDDGLLEAKNAIGTVQISRLREGWSAMEHHRQAQGQMLVTDRKYCVVRSYCRGMKPKEVRFERDEEFLRKLEIELIMFHKDLHELVKSIQA